MVIHDCTAVAGEITTTNVGSGDGMVSSSLAATPVPTTVAGEIITTNTPQTRALCT